MSFASQIQAFTLKADKLVQKAFVDSVGEVQRSVVEGSEITGAPGQPVDTGFLKNSFIGEFTSATEWQITTNTEYAPFIEDKQGAFVSPTGGAHSVKLTRAGWQKIVDKVARP